MKVFTINPIIVNGVNESYKDLYIPFDGRKASKETILAFQKYANKSGYTPALKEDGIYGSNTQKAIDSGLGKKWDDLNAYISQAPSESISKAPLTKEEKRKAFLEKGKDVVKQAKESGLWDKALGLFGVKPTTEDGSATTPEAKEDEKTSKGVNIALVIGGVALVGAIIYFVTKKK